MIVLTETEKRRHVVSPLDTVPIKVLVEKGADIVAPVWPLKNFIAVNPLQGLEHLPFEQAVLKAHRQIAITSELTPGREMVNRELIKWCSAYLDEGQATIAMPGRKVGLYNSFVKLARYDSRLNRSHSDDSVLESLPDSPEEAIAECLDHLEIIEDQKEEFIRQALAALPGWSGYVKWKENWQCPAEYSRQPATLVDYVAVRLVLTRLLWPEASVVKSLETPKLTFLTELHDRETKYRKSLLRELLTMSAAVPSSQSQRPDAQFVFCIDVRSEPFRRALESLGNYATLGFAGFFGLPVQVQGLDDDHPHHSCPVLLKPRHLICDHVIGSDATRVRRHAIGRSLWRLPKSLYRWLKYNFATPFALVEMLGPWCGLRMFARTYAPMLASGLAKKTHSSILPTIPTEPELESIELSQQADYGESALRMMGLTDKLAPVIVLCGHGSSTNSNAYASALDCGACGGNRGGGNARILAAILNSPSVQKLLANRGLAIEPDTLFVAAEHDTTTDHVELYAPHNVSDEQNEMLNRLRRDLSVASCINANARAETLGSPMLLGNRAVLEINRRSSDWAEVRPEWGLARNAAIIIGPRELTRSVNLEGRCFLHSYDWKTDSSGNFLTTILTAPMVVAQWINSQYLFSTVNNIAFGAGSKITQNVTGKFGVMQGNASDLMHGLPMQSVYSADGKPYHEPLRLLTVVYAPRSLLGKIIGDQIVLKKLFCNGWVTLTCIDPTENQAYLLNRDLTWEIAC